MRVGMCPHSKWRVQTSPHEDSSAAKYSIKRPVPLGTALGMSLTDRCHRTQTRWGPRHREMRAAMRTFLGTVLSIIAVGVLLIAYGLLSPRAAAAPYGLPAADAYQVARPMPVNDVVSLNDQAA